MMRLIDWLNEQLLHVLGRLDPARREILIGFIFLGLLLATGTTGYSLLEGWPWVDGFYMTFITLTTIGFNEVAPLSVAGRFFTIFIALTGIGTVAFIATRMAQLLLTGARMQERTLRKRILRMEAHYILCGYGRIGQRIAADLHHAGRPFLVIDHSEAEIEALRAANFTYLYGDAEDEETLRKAGIERARGLILTLPEDSTNVFVTLIGRELNPDLFILARTNQVKNQSKLLHAGADKVISPDEIGADRMAQVLLRPNVDRFIQQVMPTGATSLLIEEVEVQPGSSLAGNSLATSDFRQRFDAVVIAFIRAVNGELVFNPSPQAQIAPRDILIVLGSVEMIARLRQEGCSA